MLQFKTFMIHEQLYQQHQLGSTQTVPHTYEQFYDQHVTSQ